MARVPTLRDAATDLLLGGSCLGCGAPGRLVCPSCRAALPDEATPHWPTPPPPGLVAPYAVTAYDGLARALVLGHKEHRLLALTPVLGRLLACSVAAAVRDLAAASPRPVLLVPVPSRPASVRARGHDPTLAMTRAAAGALAGRAVVVPLLRTRPGVVDQAGLDTPGPPGQPRGLDGGAHRARCARSRGVASRCTWWSATTC